MTLKKCTGTDIAVSDADKKRETPLHRYPTRWKLRQHAPCFSLHSQAPRVEDKAKDRALVPCKRRKEERHTSYLPREIIFSILLFVPAEVLHEVMKYVCKLWYDIVSDPLFITRQCQKASAGFIIHSPLGELQPYYCDVDSARLKVTEIYIPPTEVQIPFPAIIFGSCNGLVVLYEVTNPRILIVTNLVTKVKFSLPPLKNFRDYMTTTGFTIDSSGHYKVVHVSDHTSMKVFTLGVDKAWRSINLQRIPVPEEDRYALLLRPRSIGGLIYWCNTLYPSFALDVDTETMYWFSSPDRGGILNPTTFISMGTCLGFVRQDWEENKMSRIWKLTNVRSGEWTEVAGFCVRPMMTIVDKSLNGKGRGFTLIKVTDEYIWYCRRLDDDFVVVRYNRANESFVFSQIEEKRGIICVLHPHLNTLLSPNNCYPCA